MTATYEQARDEMLALVKAAWDTTGYAIAWPDVPNDSLPPSLPVSWARVTLRHVGGRQRGFSDTARRFERSGFLTVQVFTPRGSGLSRGYQLAKIVGDALEGQATPRAVWFRNVRITEVGPDGNFSQVNVVAEFSYDEVK